MAAIFVLVAFVGNGWAQSETAARVWNDALADDCMDWIDRRGLDAVDREAASAACSAELRQADPDAAAQLIDAYMNANQQFIDYETAAALRAELDPALHPRLHALAIRQSPDTADPSYLDEVTWRLALAGDDPLARNYLSYAGWFVGYRAGDSDMMQAFADRLDRSARQSSSVDLRLNALNVMGVTGGLIDDPVAQVGYFREMINLAEANGSAEYAIRGLKNLSMVFDSVGDHETALDLTNEALAMKLAQRGPDKPGLDIQLALLYSSRGVIYAELDQLDEAIASLQISETMLEGQEVYFSGSNWLSLSDLYARMDRPDPAMDYARRAEAFYGDAGNDSMSARVQLTMAEIAIATGDERAARQRMDEVLTYLEAEYGGPEGLEEMETISEDLQKVSAETCSALNALSDHATASAYCVAALNLSERLTADDKLAFGNAKNLIALREAGLATRMAEADADQARDSMARAQARSNADQTRMWAAVLIALAAVLATVAVWRALRAQKRLSKFQQIYVADIHHRAKNHLQILMSLLNRRSSTGEVFSSRDIDDLQRQAQAMAVLHDELQGMSVGEGSDIDVGPVFRRLVDTVAASYDAADRIAEVALQPARLEVGLASPLCLILTECLSNSFKHSDDSRISVALTHAPGPSGRLDLNISDTGPGFDTSIFARDAQRASLGLSLIRDLADQIGATVEVTSRPGRTRWHFGILA